MDVKYASEPLVETSLKRIPEAESKPEGATAVGLGVQTEDPTAAQRSIAAAPPEDLWQKIREGFTWSTDDNPQIERARDAYLRQTDFMPIMSQRSELFLYYIVEEVHRRQMPMEIALLPLVESAMDPMAYSQNRAAGLWQIMPKTGVQLGLQQDWWYDGRRSLRDSTGAALDYLQQLHERFEGDWLLALAAYNAGKGRVLRAQRVNLDRGLETDYWSLTLPRETRQYVPKLMALTQLVADPDAYGVTIPPIKNAPAFDVADTGGQIEMAKAAELADTELDTLRWLNAGQLRWATSPERRSELLVPFGRKKQLETAVAQLKPEERVSWRHYTIQSGDNLIGIAKRFDTQVSLLRQVNGIRGSMIRAGATLMIPGNPYSTSLAGVDLGPMSPIDYRVKRGDSLYVIAGRFNVTVAEIVSWNALDPDKFLQPGQTLTLHAVDR
ncbi:MAG: LysM peptidoglycan-binding domain-containing protein [Pseudomonadota bacterium]